VPLLYWMPQLALDSIAPKNAQLPWAKLKALDMSRWRHIVQNIRLQWTQPKH
jgi:hypothetical protein